MSSVSQTHTAVLPEFPLVSSDAKISGIGEDSSPISARPPVGILCGLAIFCLIGIAFAFWLRTVPAGNPDPRSWFNVFYVLFARNEVAGLAVAALFSSAAVWWISHKRTKALLGGAMPWVVSREKWCLAIGALSVFVIATLGTQIVFHNYAAYRKLIP
jgi:hypothetical protein